MLEVTFTMTPEGIGLTMDGHAGYGKKGQDILCAAASVLAYTAAQLTAQMAADGKLSQPPEIRLEPGCCRIFAKAEKGFCYEVFHSFFVVQVGFHLLATRYPENVKLVSFA